MVRWGGSIEEDIGFDIGSFICSKKILERLWGFIRFSSI